jgi:glycosyltransferase involved in cell wall biosynthesis
VTDVHFMIATFDGALRHYGHLMRHLQQSGHVVHLWTMDAVDAALVDELVPGLRAQRLPLDRMRPGLPDAVRTLAASLRIARRHPHALFTTWGIQTNLFCGAPLRLLGRRCVYLLAGMGTMFSSDRLRYRLARRLVVPTYRWMMSGPHSRVIVQNDDDLAYVIEELGIPRDHVHKMFGCGVERRDFPYAPGLSTRRPKVVLVPARIIREKGVYDVARASRLLVDRGVEHELWFSAGPDPGNPLSLDDAEVAALPRLSPAIRVLGRQPSIVPLLDAAWAVCLPTYREGLPTALVEAAAYGRPIVTTDVIGARDAVTHGHSGLVVPVRDAPALADALEQVLRDEVLAERLRTNARADYLRLGTKEATLAQALPAYHSLGVAPAAAGGHRRG